MVNHTDLTRLLLSAFGWMVVIYLILYIAIPILPLQFGFLGGKVSEHTSSPHFWSFINFDGKHYLSIAEHGYRPLQHFYFPFYVVLTNFLSAVLLMKAPIAGLLVSRISFVLAIIGLFKLFILDQKKSTAYRAIFLLLLFPTSFYFISYYTESLFLMLTVWAFYFARTKRWIHAGILISLATATRIIGLAVIFALLFELIVQWKELNSRQRKQAMFSFLIMPVGILGYMYFLFKNAGDPFIFFNKLQVFGEQRSTSLVMLPQVFYRYLVRIIPNINYAYLPIVFVTFMELVSAMLLTVFSFYSLLKLRTSYVVYLVLAFLIPTFSGSFSSLPRYTLVIFPAFLLASLILDRIGRVYRLMVYAILFITLAISASMFFRGYWIA